MAEERVPHGLYRWMPAWLSLHGLHGLYRLPARASAIVTAGT